MLDHLLSDFNTLKKFDDYIKVLIFYHVDRCEKDDCSQCLFTVNLRYLFTEHEVQEKKDVVRLRYYCIMRKEQFIASRLFIHRLVSLEKKKRIQLEKGFKETLSLWNNKRDVMSSPLPNLGQ